MWNYWNSAIYPAALILYITIDTDCSLDAGVALCTATAMDTTSTMIGISRTNGSTFHEFDLEPAYMRLGLCPNKENLKISWMLNETYGLEFKLCYKMHALRDGSHLVTHCFLLHIPRLDHQTLLDCWFRMDYVEKRPIIKAWAGTVDDDAAKHYYGAFSVGGIDLNNTCSDICDRSVVHISKRLISCTETGLIRYDNGVHILQVCFAATNQASCRSVELDSSKQTDGVLAFSFRCAQNGIGKIYVLYIIQDNYCRIYHQISVVCDKTQLNNSCSNATTRNMNVTSSTTSPRDQPVPVPVLVALLLVLVIVSTIISIIVFVIRRRRPRGRGRTEETRRNNRNINMEQSVNLNSTNSTTNHHTGEADDITVAFSQGAHHS